MKLSIIIPAYNAEKYLTTCLNSIPVNDNIEIIVVDDGSIDNTSKLAIGYINVKLFKNDNHGVSYSRNYGIEKAHGDYIMFVDADDYLKFDWYNLITNYKFTEDVIYITKGINIPEKKEELLKYIVGIEKPCIAGPYCKLFKTSFLRENNIKFKDDVINGEDMLFNIECISKLNNFKIISESIYMYRQNLGSATKKYSENILESDKKFHIYLKSILSELAINDKFANLIKDYSKSSAIFTLIDRMAYIRNYNKFKKTITFINDIEYK